MTTHECPGDTCTLCARRIERAESQDPDCDYDPGRDWHYPIGGAW